MKEIVYRVTVVCESVLVSSLYHIWGYVYYFLFLYIPYIYAQKISVDEHKYSIPIYYIHRRRYIYTHEKEVAFLAAAACLIVFISCPRANRMNE